MLCRAILDLTNTATTKVGLLAPMLEVLSKKSKINETYWKHACSYEPFMHVFPQIAMFHLLSGREQ